MRRFAGIAFLFLGIFLLLTAVVGWARSQSVTDETGFSFGSLYFRVDSMHPGLLHVCVIANIDDEPGFWVVQLPRDGQLWRMGPGQNNGVLTRWLGPSLAVECGTMGSHLGLDIPCPYLGFVAPYWLVALIGATSVGVGLWLRRLGVRARERNKASAAREKVRDGR